MDGTASSGARRGAAWVGAPAREAVARLVTVYGARLDALARRICGNRADAEDLVQDVFLQAYRRWETFRGASDPGTWLYAITANACRRRFRRRGSAQRMPTLSQLLPWRESRSLDLPAVGGGAEGPTAQVIERESARLVQDAIASLPEGFRVPLVLKEMLELPIADVAGALRLKPETVKTRVHRARLLLRKALLDPRGMPTRPAATPIYERRVCLDLLKAKLEAMDHGRGFPVGQDVVCARCRAVFAELDLAQQACAELAEGHVTERLRRRIARAILEADGHRPVRQGGGVRQVDRPNGR